MWWCGAGSWRRAAMRLRATVVAKGMTLGAGATGAYQVGQSDRPPRDSFTDQRVITDAVLLQKCNDILSESACGVVRKGRRGAEQASEIRSGAEGRGRGLRPRDEGGQEVGNRERKTQVGRGACSRAAHLRMRGGSSSPGAAPPPRPWQQVVARWPPLCSLLATRWWSHVLGGGP